MIDFEILEVFDDLVYSSFFRFQFFFRIFSSSSQWRKQRVVLSRPETRYTTHRILYGLYISVTWSMDWPITSVMLSESANGARRIIYGLFVTVTWSLHWPIAGVVWHVLANHTHRIIHGLFVTVTWSLHWPMAGVVWRQLITPTVLYICGLFVTWFGSANHGRCRVIWIGRAIRMLAADWKSEFLWTRCIYLCCCYVLSKLSRFSSSLHGT